MVTSVNIDFINDYFRLLDTPSLRYRMIVVIYFICNNTVVNILQRLIISFILTQIIVSALK